MDGAALVGSIRYGGVRLAVSSFRWPVTIRMLIMAPACIEMQRAPDQIERPKFRRPISIMRPQSLYLGGEHDSDSLETSHAWPVYFINFAYAIWDNLSLSRALLKVWVLNHLRHSGKTICLKVSNTMSRRLYPRVLPYLFCGAWSWLFRLGYQG